MTVEDHLGRVRTFRSDGPVHDFDFAAIPEEEHWRPFLGETPRVVIEAPVKRVNVRLAATLLGSGENGQFYTLTVGAPS